MRSSDGDLLSLHCNKEQRETGNSKEEASRANTKKTTEHKNAVINSCIKLMYLLDTFLKFKLWPRQEKS